MVFFLQADQALIVDRHNVLRRRVALGQETRGAGGLGSNLRQEPAANMRRMDWDDDLAEVAQRWADQCQDAHDRRHERAIPGFRDVGQNVVSFWSSRYSDQRNYTQLIQRWYDEVRMKYHI